MRSSFVAAGAVALLVTTAPVASAQNLVSNPGFETGDFSAWTTISSPFNGVDEFNPHSGNFGAFFGEDVAITPLSQQLATIPGVTYTLSFWLQNEGNASNLFAALWDGTEVTALTDADPFGYTRFSFAVLASSLESMLQFRFRHETSFWDLDDVSVTAESTIPEPATMTLLATGLAGMAAGRRRRRRTAS